MGSLRWRLVLAMVATAWLSVAAVGLISTSLTAQRLDTYLRHASAMPMAGMRRMMVQMMGAPEQRLLADVRRATWLAALAGAVLAAVVGTVTARRITAPLRRLADAAGRIGAGDLTSTVPAAGDDELGELARTFNAMAADLRRAEEARRRLLADIAHELGTPLAVLQANVEGMLDGVVESSPERLASLHAQIRVLTRLVRDLRDLSLAQQGQLPLDRRAMDLAALTREVVELSRPLAEEKGIALTVHAPGALPVVADRDRIAQVLQNLLANALRYTEHGGVTVAVQGDAAEGMVEVSDSGPGIPAEELPYVFERFYRVDRSRARATGGAGLGLTIVKTLVEAHGGRVWARSRPGQGSTFGFALPVRPPAAVGGPEGARPPGR
ncbi:MAG: ATP-binding protein [Armatimonadota bacterium]|nr:ATP-binding protein [Armatimonadota bacterium]